MSQLSLQRIPYVYQKNEIVFAETIGHKPYPAKITSVNRTTGVYRVSFIGYKCTSDLLAQNLEKFTPENISKYEQQYRNSKKSEDKTILKKLSLAKKQQNRMYKSKTMMVGFEPNADQQNQVEK